MVVVGFVLVGGWVGLYFVRVVGWVGGGFGGLVLVLSGVFWILRFFVGVIT